MYKKGQKPKKRSEAKKAPCPLSVATNDVSWYLRDGTPRFAGEFDMLQKIGVTNRVLTNGIQLDAALHHSCVVAPPVDDENSFYKQMATLLSKVRKKNTGANIYNTEAMCVYNWKILIAETLFASACRDLHATKYVFPGNADSPWVALNIANADRVWTTESANWADTWNEMDIVAKMIDALPRPAMAARDRNRFLFSRLFADSRGGKPSFTAFQPFRVQDMSCTTSGGVTTITCTDLGNTVAGTITATMTAIRNILADIYSDTGANFTMLRGDLMKFFPPQPTCSNMLREGLKVEATSAELASQLENASILGRTTAGNTTATFSATGCTLSIPCAGILNPTLYSKAELAEQPINSRNGVPSDGELMAITALMPFATKQNGATSTDWIVHAHNGIVIWTSVLVKGTAMSTVVPTADKIDLGFMLADVNSSVQSTMKTAFERLNNIASIVSHCPMLITDATEPDGYIWDVDYIGFITQVSLQIAITRVVRSLYQVNLPEARL